MHLQIEDTYLGHPKTEMLRELVGPEADIYPIRLWDFALKYAIKGTLKSADMVEKRVGWKGPPGKLHKALITAGFLEDDGVTIHDWEEYTGRWINAYESRKKEAKDARAAYKAQKQAIWKEKFKEMAPAYEPIVMPEKAEEGPPEGPEEAQEPEEAPPAPPKYDIASSADATLHRLFLIAKKKIQGRDDTIRQYLQKWISAKGGAYVDEVIHKPEVFGQSVIQVQKFFFDTLGNGNGGFLGNGK